MRQIVSFVVALVVIYSLASCENGKRSKENTEDSDVKTETVTEADTLPVLKEILIDSLGNTLTDTVIIPKHFFSDKKYASYRKYHQSGHVDDPCPSCQKRSDGRTSSKKKVGQYVFYRLPMFIDVALCYNTHEIDSLDFNQNLWAVVQQRDVYVGNEKASLMIGFELCNMPDHDDCPHEHPHPQLPQRLNVIPSAMTQHDGVLHEFQYDIYSGGDEYGLVKHDTVILLAVNNKKLGLSSGLNVKYRVGSLKISHNSKDFSVPVAYDIEQR